MKNFLCIVSVASLPTALLADQTVQNVTLTDMRGMVFCEFLLISDTDVTIYNTSANGKCDLDTFAKLDTGEIAKEHGAKAAQLNGPKYWIMDEQTLGLGETKSFGGIEARYAATLPLSALGSGEGSDPYKPYVSAKQQAMTFKAGQPVYELVDGSGQVYVLNAYGAAVRNGDPANLADQLKPAEGWTFRVSTPTEDLTILGSSDAPVSMVGDDMHQYYTRIDTSTK